MSETTKSDGGAPGLKNVRSAALKKARTLAELLEQDVHFAQRRLEAVRRTIAHLEGDASLGVCPLPNSDIVERAERALRATVAVESLINLGYDLEG